MKAGRVLASGASGQILTEALLSEAYDIDAEVIYDGAGEARIARAVLPRRPSG
jgi:ABC-type cobalamin/Fe3+-siderophores transport system ATPase subunit